MLVKFVTLNGETPIHDMKTIIEKKFDAVQYMRAQRERLSEQLLHMTKEEIIAYFKEKKVKNTVKPS